MRLKIFTYLCLLTLLTSLSAAVHAQTFSVIHTFTGTGGEGSFPEAGLTLRGGALYGTASQGGNNVFDWGTVYQLTRAGSDWVSTSLFVFNGEDGEIPQARVVFGPDHHLYGVTSGGGQLSQYGGAGVVFNLTPPLSICKTLTGCVWKQDQLYTFDGFFPTNGAFPGYGDLVWDQQGNIYGTATQGGASNVGVVYKLTPSGNEWQQSVIYSFPGKTGAGPYAGVIFDSQGNLLGTAGGGLGGIVYKLTDVPGVGWQESLVYQFQNGSDGEGLNAGLVADSSGNLYGATMSGGSGGGGTIFELSPSGNGYTFNLLYSLPGSYVCGPQANLALDAAGNLYGTTRCDGAYQSGNVFKLSNTPNGWVYTSLHDFTGGSDGMWPYSNVTIDSDGTLYGTAAKGGSFEGDCNHLTPPGCGVVWMIKP